MSATPSSSPPPGAKTLWSSYSKSGGATKVSQSSRYARGTRHTPDAAELEPLSRRCLQAAGALSLLLLLVVVNSLLNDGSESPFNPNPVAAAAERTAEVPGMRIDMTMSMSTEAGALLTGTGKGAYNSDTNLAGISYDMSSQGKRLEFDAILGESAWYFRYPQLAGKTPVGKEWMKIGGFPAQEEMSTPGVVSPDESLDMLRGSATVQRLGGAEVRHVRTIRYRVTQTPAEILDVLRAEGKDELAEQFEQASAQIVGPVHSEVFIDRHGVLRRMRMASTVSSRGHTATTRIRMDFFDFGIKPDIQVPDDSQVYDLTPLLQEKLDALGEAT